MLTEAATNLTVALVAATDSKVGGKEFKILSWDEIAQICNQESATEELKALFEEVRLNGCLVQKYKDEDEVCFAMTDKAILLKQDLDALVSAKEGKQTSTMVKVDDNGNSMVVIPPASNLLMPAKGKNKGSEKFAPFFLGLGGGILGGGIVYAIIYLIQLFI